MCNLLISLQIIASGLEWDGPAIQALMDCCAGYPHVKNICCWGTQIGDQVNNLPISKSKCYLCALNLHRSNL